MSFQGAFADTVDVSRLNILAHNIIDTRHSDNAVVSEPYILENDQVIRIALNQTGDEVVCDKLGYGAVDTSYVRPELQHIDPETGLQGGETTLLLSQDDYGNYTGTLIRTSRYHYVQFACLKH